MTKALVRRLFPRSVFFARNLLGRLSPDEVTSCVLRACNSTVVAGPFEGMRYIGRANGSVLAPKLLGTYERELHAVIETVVGRPYVEILDAGSAEGYYAVGLALRMPGATVHAFDVDPSARENLIALADLNGVGSRIRIHGECTVAQLQEHAGRQCLLICDIEGGERTLLDPKSASALLDFDIVVEIHDGPDSDEIHRLLCDRFGRTHDLEFIRYAGRGVEDARRARGLLSVDQRLQAVDEGRRYGLEWGFFRCRRWSDPLPKLP